MLLTIGERLKSLVPVHIPAEIEDLPKGDQQALPWLIRASKCMDEIFFEQVSKDNLELHVKLCQQRNDPEGAMLLRYFLHMGGPWDRFRENEPFISDVGLKPRGAGFYPPDMTRESWNIFIAGNPEYQSLFENHYTMITGWWRATTYAKVWKSHLNVAHAMLLNASECATSSDLRTFLRSRAEAFMSNEYDQSDLDWLRVTESPIEVTMGPYEEYEDDFLKCKRSFEAMLVKVDREETNALGTLQKYILPFNQILAKEYGYSPSGILTPMIVGDLLFSAGEARRHGFIPAAYNLPNDGTVKSFWGSKKVFLKNIFNARMEHTVFPVIRKIFDPARIIMVTSPDFFHFIKGHEAAHDDGPHHPDIRYSLKEYADLIEEAKADTVGMMWLWWLSDQEYLPYEEARRSACAHILYLPRELRFGFEDDHARGALIQWNWYVEKGAIRYWNEWFTIDLSKMRRAVESLGHELLRLQCEKSYEGVKQFVEKWSVVPEDLQNALKRCRDLPIEIEPVFELPQKLGIAYPY